ncbi:MAG: diguanylate cyclase [Herminiimonas sp.]|nr:diguanylate cyclase [Herminiimonas sp.]
MSDGSVGADLSLEEQLVETAEIAQFVPEKALKQLLRLDRIARAAGPETKAEYLTQLSVARRGTGHQDQAIALADEAIALGKAQSSPVALAKGLMAKGELMLIMNELDKSHQLLWESERIATTTKDMALRIQTAILAGQAYAEDGNFPQALVHLQAAVALARQYEKPISTIMALNSMARLYRQMKDFDKGFDSLNEAIALATEINSPARMASLLNTEYLFAMDTGQPARGSRALLSALALQHQLGDTATIDITLVNLSDSYLKQKDYRNTLSYATQAIEAARRFNHEAVEATAHVNIGEAQLGMGRLADSKRSFETGLALYEKSGDKPALQSVLLEYGAALEQAGDMAGAVRAYHRERTISNALFEAQRQKAIWELQGKYEADKKERRIELLSRENQVKSAEIDNRRLQQRVWWLLAAVFALASLVVGILYRKIRHANSQLQVKNLELKQQSSRDPLTALYNRRHYQEFMRSHVPFEKRGVGTSGDEVVGALFLLDVDHFKAINDTHGHAAGDAVLKMIAENLGIILRETDMIVRWGGEEFLAFLPAVSRSGIDDIAHRLLTGISAQGIEYQGTRLSVNVSIGYAPFPLAPDGVPLPWERVVNLVDMALYLAKSHGRNRAYGIHGFADLGRTSMDAIEQNLEGAWRAGFVNMSTVLGGAADEVADARFDMAKEAAGMV